MTSYGAGPPFFTLNFTPKSLLMPPGLWLAVRSIPPKQFPTYELTSLMYAEQAGVDINPPCATWISETPLAQAIPIILYIASLL